MSALPIASARQKWARAFGDSSGSISLGGLRDPHEIGQPVSPLADVVAHRPGDVLVAPRRDQCLNEKEATGVGAAGQPPADDQEQFRDRPAGICREHVAELSPAMSPQRIDQQFRLRAKMRVQGSVAHARGRRDVGHPRAVIPPLGEHVGGCPQQPITRLGGGDARDAAHAQN